MIRYALKCSNDHSFESWFQSAEAFEALSGASMLECPVCGTAEVKKAIMAPRVSGQSTDVVAVDPSAQKLAAFKRHVEENADYVGTSFAEEARAIHDGEKPGRAIYGETALPEARALLEDGVPVAPLPFLPTRKAN